MSGHLHRTVVTLTTATLLASLALATMAVPTNAAGKVTCGGKAATIVGTRKRDVIYGTKRADVIAGLGGNDVIIGRGGNDIICGGPGADRLVGKAGFDRLYGNAGPDKLVGGNGPDRLFGGVGNDRLAGQAGNDLLNGGPGTDTCYQGAGLGSAKGCELPVPLPAPQPGPTLIPLTGILAVAYSDIDGLDGYSTGDVLISKLVDTNGDEVPSSGDSVVMDRYPDSFAATSFGDWNVTSHVIDTVDIHANSLGAWTSGGDEFGWARQATFESYLEATPWSVIQDVFDGGSDQIAVLIGSPSAPASYAEVYRLSDVDDRFIDVELNYVVP